MVENRTGFSPLPWFEVILLVMQKNLSALFSGRRNQLVVTIRAQLFRSRRTDENSNENAKFTIRSWKEEQKLIKFLIRHAINVPP